MKIRIAGVISINVPMKRRTTFIISNNIILFELIPKRSVEIASGIPVNVITQAIKLDTPIRKTIIPVVIALSLIIPYKSLIFIVL